MIIRRNRLLFSMRRSRSSTETWLRRQYWRQRRHHHLMEVRKRVNVVSLIKNLWHNSTTLTGRSLLLIWTSCSLSLINMQKKRGRCCNRQLGLVLLLWLGSSSPLEVPPCAGADRKRNYWGVFLAERCADSHFLFPAATSVSSVFAEAWHRLPSLEFNPNLGSAVTGQETHTAFFLCPQTSTRLQSRETPAEFCHVCLKVLRWRLRRVHLLQSAVLQQEFNMSRLVSSGNTERGCLDRTESLMGLYIDVWRGGVA